MKKTIPDSAVLIPPQAKCVFEGVIYSVYQWPQEMFDGSKATFEMLRRPDTVSAICIVGDNVVVLDEAQPHSGARRSLAGGRVDEEDESILSAAKREILEETGYTFNNWKLISVAQPLLKIEWFIHLFIAWDKNKQIASHQDVGEKITAELLPFSELKKMVLANQGHLGEIRDVIENVNTLEELLAIAEFKGKTLER